jgi:hypothetical protein
MLGGEDGQAARASRAPACRHAPIPKKPVPTAVAAPTTAAITATTSAATCLIAITAGTVAVAPRSFAHVREQARGVRDVGVEVKIECQRSIGFDQVEFGEQIHLWSTVGAPRLGGRSKWL